MNIFKRASQLRKQHPRKYDDYQDYVAWAKKELKGKGQKRSAPKKKAHKKAYRRLVPVKGIIHAKAVGSVAFHRSQARKQLEEQLAWLLLSRDQAKTKRERLKLSKKVALKRQELHKMK